MLLRTISTSAPLVKPDGSVLASVKLSFLLCDSSGVPISAFRLDTHENVSNRVTVTTDAFGHFSVSLAPNDQLSGDTWYLVMALSAHGLTPFKSKLLSGSGPVSFADFYASGQSLTAAEASALALHVQDAFPHLSSSERSALSTANAPSALNPIATLADTFTGANPNIISAPAAQALGGHRMAVITAAGLADYADNTIPAHADLVHGLTTGAVASGDMAQVLTRGEITEPSWNWTPGLPLYLVSNGLMSQTPPVSGFSLPAGSAISPTKIFIEFQPPTLLI